MWVPAMARVPTRLGKFQFGAEWAMWDAVVTTSEGAAREVFQDLDVFKALREPSEEFAMPTGSKTVQPNACFFTFRSEL